MALLFGRVHEPVDALNEWRVHAVDVHIDRSVPARRRHRRGRLGWHSSRRGRSRPSGRRGWPTPANVGRWRYGCRWRQRGGADTASERNGLASALESCGIGCERRARGRRGGGSAPSGDMGVSGCCPPGSRIGAPAPALAAVVGVAVGGGTTRASSARRSLSEPAEAERTILLRDIFARRGLLASDGAALLTTAPADRVELCLHVDGCRTVHFRLAPRGEGCLTPGSKASGSAFGAAAKRVRACHVASAIRSSRLLCWSCWSTASRLPTAARERA